VITGGNSGLGYGCARALLAASPRWHVVLACRELGRANEAADTLRAAAPSGAKVEAMALDLASLASVRSFAETLAERLRAGTLPPLHGLVCNAGMQGARALTADGFEATFGVNHLGHYLLVNLLLPSLEKPARIAVVASGVHDPVQLADFPSAGVPPPAWSSTAELAKGVMGPAAANDDANADRGRRYSTSKLANVYFTYALAPRLPDGVTVNAFDPGLMPGTGLAREYPAPLRWVWNAVLPRMLPLMRLLISENIHSTEASGAALARLITDPALASTNGKYFEGVREIRSSVDSYDEGRAAEVWQTSAVLTGLA
jgi:NAD(P)-dependent dehydrogenase (short-subunit alcohol dehydrogenase family)